VHAPELHNILFFNILLMGDAMNKAEGIIIDALTRASIRIHWVFLANLILAALVFSSVYAREISYDKSLVNSAQIFILEAEEKLQALEKTYPGSILLKKPNETSVEVAGVNSWLPEDRKTYGEWIARQQRAINVLRSYTLNTAETPVISSKISPNDFDVFCGFLMAMLSMWIFFSTNQIAYLVNHPKTKAIIQSYVWAVRHIFVTMHFNEPLVRTVVTTAVIFLPFVAMLASTVVTMNTAPRIESASYNNIVMEAFDTLVRIKQIISGILLFFAIAILAVWLTVLQRLKDDG
jgi:hypothetical protein